MKKYMIAVISVASVLLTALLLTLVANLIVIGKASDSDIFECDEVDKLSKRYGAIVVLGAGLKEDGTPSHMLEDRLRGAVALYAAGVSERVILSGDNSGEDYDEVSAMEKYCLEHGVPSEAIIRDDIGFSTYETMSNVIGDMKYNSIIVVTQKYHLYRAIYIAEKMGAEADGFAADYRSYFLQIKRDVREYFARIKDLIMVNFSLR